MDKELEIILDIIKMQGTNEKIEYLKENYNNKRLKEILYYTFNPMYVFGISNKKIKKEIKIEKSYEAKEILELLKYLKGNNTGTDQIIANIQYFMKNQDERYEKLLIDIITKSLKIGVNAKSINKVWKDFIPDYEVQQGEKIENNIERLFSNEIIVTQKFDGQRCSARVENHEVIMYSRNGKIYEGLNELKEELSKLDDGMYDGELLLNIEEKRNEKNIPDFIHSENFEEELLKKIYAPMPSKELFKKTASLVNSDVENKLNVNFWLYDYTPLKNFDNMEEYIVPVEERKLYLKEIINKHKFKYLKEVKYLYKGIFDNIKIQNMLNQVIDLQQEGLMINICKSPYKFERSNNMLKVKKMYPVDLRVIDILEGSGVNKGKTGALVVNYKGNPLKVGSGLTKEQREKFWENKELIMGKIITIKYFEETTNKKDNTKSLRFPIFLEVREDKDEESYN